MGGGVACYIHDSLKAKIISASPSTFSNSPEYLILEIRSSESETLLFVSAYRRPKGRMFGDLVIALNQVLHLYKNIIIAGDLNCNLSTTGFYASYLQDLVHSLSLHIVHSEATFHSASVDSWLDVIIVDDEDKIAEFEKSESPFIAGHDLLELSYKFSTPNNVDRVIVRRNYGLVNCPEFLEYIQTQLGHLDFVDAHDVDNFCASLSGKMIDGLNIYAPIQIFKSTRPPKPWITDELRARLKHRDTLYKQAKRSKSLLGFAIYRHFRNALDEEIKRARSQFQFDALKDIKDPAKLWRKLAHLGLAKTTEVSPLHFFQPGELNQYYVSVSNTEPMCSYENFLFTTKNVQRSDIRPEFCFSIVSPEDIQKVITYLPLHSFAAGSDGISLNIIRLLWSAISERVTSLYNNSLVTGIFPSDWKRAYIRPLSKIRTPNSPSDTRPIANLSELSKIFERIVAHQITKYLNDHNVLNPKQSAYRLNHSTQSALLRVVDDIKRGIDKRLMTILILFDFSKAFDIVPHLRLLCKLKEIGFSDSVLSWFYSYLTGRAQSVLDMSNNCSEWLPTTSGVPQGSVLGPLLFSLFINDISNSLHHSECMVFADDTQIYLSCPPNDIRHGFELISRDAQNIYTYALDNGLKLNLGKSKVMIFGSTTYVNALDLNNLPSIIVNNVALPIVTSAKNLGIIFTNNLAWNHHVASVSQKVHFALHKLKFHKNSLSTELRTKLVTTLIFPHLDYCCLVYHGLSKGQNTVLQRLMNCCIRFIFNLPRDEHITPYRKRLSWLTLKSRRLYFLGVSIYRTVYLDSPEYIRDLFIYLDPVLRRPLRQQIPLNFHIPTYRTTTYQKSYALSAIYLWHSLPVRITSATSLATFKSLLFAYLLELEEVA